MFKKIYILIFLFTILSCKTYEKANIVNAWTDNRDIRFIVYEVHKYNRQTDSLIEIRLDTIMIDLYDRKQFEIPYFK